MRDCHLTYLQGKNSDFEAPLMMRGNPFRKNGTMLAEQIRGSLLTIQAQLHSLFCLFLSTKCSNRIAALWSKRNDYRKEQLEKTRQKYLDFSQWESTTVTNGLRMFLFFSSSNPYANFLQHSICTSKLSKCFLFFSAQLSQLFPIRPCLFRKKKENV